MTRRVLLALSALAIVLAGAERTAAYLKFGTEVDGRSVDLKWDTLPIPYTVTGRQVPGVSFEALVATVERAFQTWEAVPSATVSFRRLESEGGPAEREGLAVIGFDDRPELDRVLGATSYTIDTGTGAIVEAEIFLNAAFAWSVDPEGEPGRYDLASIAVHEIGHLTGLGHSALGETELSPAGGRRVTLAGAVMFPVAMAPGNIDGRMLRPDDVAGLSDVYPSGDFARDTGSIAGRVTRDGRGVFGAHVVAFNLRTGSLVANFTLNDAGDYAIAGLEPGPTVVRVEPLDDADVDSFFEDVEAVDIDFQVAFARRLVVVPAGGGVPRVNIDVRGK